MPMPKLTADQALQMLMEGNKRYVAAKMLRPNQSVQRRGEVAKDQSPFAVILGCSDSRVPPEIVFDQGLGDLFVIRLAGNVLSDEALGSIEYAATHLGARLVLVLGHERCGAVDAAVKGGEAEGHLGSIVEAIRPAVAAAKGEPGDLLDNAVKGNVRRVVAQLRSSEPVLAKRVNEGKVRVAGARYDLDTGKVTLVP